MEIVVIAHNIRSTHNIGSIFRTSEGFGVTQLILSGYSPYPKLVDDSRLPHISQKLTAQIEKTALGASRMVSFAYAAHPAEVIEQLRRQGYRIVGLEQTPDAIRLDTYTAPQKICLVLGEEVEGIPTEIMQLCDEFIEIPMQGQKESFNVSVAAGIALYAVSTQSS
ncbi:MAG TPA: TrmH family RNA methyltransferase [Candidatus Saccharimonadales bacterium]|jgi:tRNA G18 (ribose-2'-O)-methylase SpoU|nr:TrmH family RNA methyltransferase [Candidatus Saccharimonadales bacterium]